jgi:hypothetical protein
MGTSTLNTKNGLISRREAIDQNFELDVGW